MFLLDRSTIPVVLKFLDSLRQKLLNCISFSGRRQCSSNYKLLNSMQATVSVTHHQNALLKNSKQMQFGSVLLARAQYVDLRLQPCETIFCCCSVWKGSFVFHMMKAKGLSDVQKKRRYLLTWLTWYENSQEHNESEQRRSKAFCIPRLVTFLR